MLKRTLTLVVLGIPGLAFCQSAPIAWVRAGHSGGVNCVAASPDGSLLASASDDRTLKVWRSGDGGYVRTFTIPYDIDDQTLGVKGAAFSPDGSMLAAAFGEYNAHQQREFGTVRIWRLSDGAMIRTLSGFMNDASSVAFSHSGGLIAASSADKTIRVWNVANGSLITSFTAHSTQIRQIAFSMDDSRLASAGDDAALKIWRTTDWSLERSLSGPTNVVMGIAFSPDGTRIAGASWDQTVRVWRLSDGALLNSLNQGSSAASVAFSANGAYLASGGSNGVINLWNGQTGGFIRALTGHTGTVLSLTFLQDNRTLVSGSWYPDYTMKMWDADLGVFVQDVTSHNAPVTDVLFAPGNRHAVSAAGSAKVWNILYGNPIRTMSGSATNIACSSDGQLLAVPGFNKDLLIYRISDGALLKTVSGFPEQVTGAAFSKDGTLLAAGAFFNGTDDKVRLFRTSDWAQVGQLSGTFLFGPFVSLGFSANGQYLAAVCEGAPAVWRLSDGAVVFHPNEGAGQIRFSADGQLLAMTGNTTKIFRVADWSLQRSLPTSMAQALDFSPDGKLLATTEYGSVKIWRVSDGSLLANYTEGIGYGGFAATSIRFSPNGRMFGYGLYDGTFVAAHNPFLLTNSPPGIGK